MLEGGRYFFRLFSGSRDVIKSLLLEIVEIAEIVARSGTVVMMVTRKTLLTLQPPSRWRKLARVRPRPRPCAAPPTNTRHCLLTAVSCDQREDGINCWSRPHQGRRSCLKTWRQETPRRNQMKPWFVMRLFGSEVIRRAMKWWRSCNSIVTVATWQRDDVWQSVAISVTYGATLPWSWYGGSHINTNISAGFGSNNFNFEEHLIIQNTSRELQSCICIHACCSSRPQFTHALRDILLMNLVPQQDVDVM